MGVLSERRWQELEWEMPADEACPCWWISTSDGPQCTTTRTSFILLSLSNPITIAWNACAPDKSQEVKMICRSLTTLRLELSSNRVATVVGIKGCKLIFGAMSPPIALVECFRRQDHGQAA